MNRKTFAAKTGAALLTASLLATSIPLGATAASVQRVTALLRPETSIVVDGSARTFYNVSGQEVHPILYNGTTYLPLRSIGEMWTGTNPPSQSPSAAPVLRQTSPAHRMPPPKRAM